MWDGMKNSFNGTYNSSLGNQNFKSHRVTSEAVKNIVDLQNPNVFPQKQKIDEN